MHPKMSATKRIKPTKTSTSVNGGVAKTEVLKKCECGWSVTSQEVRLSRFLGGVTWIVTCVHCA